MFKRLLVLLCTVAIGLAAFPSAVYAMRDACCIALDMYATEASPLPVDMCDRERALFNAINAERARHDLPLLVWDEALSDIAREHSRDMVTNGFFSHTNLDGERPGCRLRRNNIRFRVSAENLARGHRCADSVVAAWLESPSHRSALLHERATTVGIGVYNRHWTMHAKG